MKKVITAAVLLAASTALANAATVITLTDLSQDVSGDISYSADTGYLSGSSLYTTTGNYHIASVTFILNLTALGITSSDSTWSGTGSDTTREQLVDCKVSESDTSGAIGLQVSSNGLQFTWQSALWSSTSSAYLTWSSLREKSYTLGDDTCVTLTLDANTYAGSTEGSCVYYEDGTATNLSNVSLKVASKSFGVIYVNEDYIKSVSVFSGSATAEEIKTASEALKSAAIPEPSAFGLLAGVGALALVAARRRRSRAK